MPLGLSGARRAGPGLAQHVAAPACQQHRSTAAAAASQRLQTPSQTVSLSFPILRLLFHQPHLPVTQTESKKNKKKHCKTDFPHSLGKAAASPPPKPPLQTRGPGCRHVQCPPTPTGSEGRTPAAPDPQQAPPEPPGSLARRTHQSLAADTRGPP